MPHRRLLILIAASLLPLLAAGIAYAQTGPSIQPSIQPAATQPAAPDADRDGLPDAWEVQYGLKPDNANGVNGANGDPDRDGLVNGDEYANGTNPRNPDTDGDGLSDLWEVENLSNPLAAGGDDGALGDPDGDGLLNKDELARGVDPFNWDSDGDGLPDGWEVVEGISPKDNRGQHGANGIPPGRRETNYARFERFNDDFAPPIPHKARP